MTLIRDESSPLLPSVYDRTYDNKKRFCMFEKGKWSREERNFRKRKICSLLRPVHFHKKFKSNSKARVSLPLPVLATRGIAPFERQLIDESYLWRHPRTRGKNGTSPGEGGTRENCLPGLEAFLF